jgi:hypothetical protein
MAQATLDIGRHGILATAGNRRFDLPTLAQKQRRAERIHQAIETTGRAHLVPTLKQRAASGGLGTAGAVVGGAAIGSISSVGAVLSAFNVFRREDVAVPGLVYTAAAAGAGILAGAAGFDAGLSTLRDLFDLPSQPVVNATLGMGLYVAARIVCYAVPMAVVGAIKGGEAGATIGSHLVEPA